MDRLAAHYANCLEGSMEDEEPWAQLNEAVTKLALAGIPSGVSADAEIACRLEMWDQRLLLELLQRIQFKRRSAGDSLPVEGRCGETCLQDRQRRNDWQKKVPAPKLARR